MQSRVSNKDEISSDNLLLKVKSSRTTKSVTFIKSKSKVNLFLFQKTIQTSTQGSERRNRYLRIVMCQIKSLRVCSSTRSKEKTVTFPPQGAYQTKDTRTLSKITGWTWNYPRISKAPIWTLNRMSMPKDRAKKWSEARARAKWPQTRNPMMASFPRVSEKTEFLPSKDWDLSIKHKTRTSTQKEAPKSSERTRSLKTRSKS